MGVGKEGGESKTMHRSAHFLISRHENPRQTLLERRELRMSQESSLQLSPSLPPSPGSTRSSVL